MNLKRVAWAALLSLGVAFALACQGDTCAALGSTCPQRAPAPNGQQQHGAGGQPNPRRADPQPPESGEKKVDITCQWFGNYFITYTPSVGGQPGATVEKGPKNADGGTYTTTHSVAPGTNVGVQCRGLPGSMGHAQGRLECVLSYHNGAVLPGGRAYQQVPADKANLGVLCSAVA